MRLQKLLGTFLVAAVIFAGCSNDSDKHKHSWSTEYASDATTHWIKCSGCAEIKDKSVHTAAVLSRNETNHWKVCDVCGGNYEVTVHTWNHEDYQYDSESGKEIRTCTECSYVDDQEHQHETTAALSKDGTNHWKVCDVCGGNYEVTAHTEDEGTVTTEPTCVTKGIRTYKCTVCKEVLRTENVEALGHTDDAGTVTTAPTCVTKGVRTFKCAVCEEMLRTEEIEVTAHTDDAGTVSNEPTCVTKGVMIYNCAVCKAYLRTEEIPELYSSPVDAETGLAATSSSTYIYFGVFPQALKTSTVYIDKTKSVDFGWTTYYKGDDGEYYVEITANPCSDSGSYDKYSNGNIITAETAYFKVEPIKWKVLTNTYDIDGEAGSDTGTLLLAEKILTANIPYYDYNSNGSSSERTINSETVYANNYMYSAIRAYLNGKYEKDDPQTKIYNNAGFLQTAFTVAAQNKINTTFVSNNAETTIVSNINGDYYATEYACEDTLDKVFLLSMSEMVNSNYGFMAGDKMDLSKQRKVTDYAMANYAYQNKLEYNGKWLLRSPDYRHDLWVRGVGFYGHLNEYPSVIKRDCGIVPALTISLE